MMKTALACLNEYLGLLIHNVAELPTRAVGESRHNQTLSFAKPIRVSLRDLPDVQARYCRSNPFGRHLSRRCKPVLNNRSASRGASGRVRDTNAVAGCEDLERRSMTNVTTVSSIRSSTRGGPGAACACCGSLRGLRPRHYALETANRNPRD